LAGLLAAVLLLAACGTTQSPSSPSMTSSAPSAYTDIGPAELAGMLEQTDLFIPFEQAAELIDRLPADKAARIVAYCRSDRRSRIAVEEWAKAGYTNLSNLHGGFEAWEAAGYPLLQLDGE
jgi:rhodanese-related sulfurtransferase